MARNYVRGIRTPIPAGSVVGRPAGAGTGVGQIIPVNQLLQSLQAAGIPIAGGGLPAISNDELLANISGGTTTPSGQTLSAVFDAILGNTEGQIIQRGASGWQVLAPGTAGQVLTSGGASALNSWQSGGGASFSDQGAWGNTSAYVEFDVVQYNGSSYCCFANLSIPSINPAPWGSAGGMNLTTTNYTHDTATSITGACYALTAGNGQTSGKQYFEFEITNGVDNGAEVGFGVLGATSIMTGNRAGVITGNFPGSGTSFSFTGIGNGDRGAVAADLTNELIWITRDVTALPVVWNGGGTANPSTGVGGVATGTITGAVFPLWETPTTSGQVCVIYTTSAGFIIPAVPTSFVPWGVPATTNPTPDTDDAHWFSQGAINTVDGKFTITSGELTLTPIASGDVLGNSGSSAAEPAAATVTAMLDRALGSTEGQILQRGSTAWQVLAPGTAGQVLESGGAGALNAWASPATGYITAVDSNFTVSGTTLELATIASGDVLGNSGSSTAEPAAATITAMLDRALGSTEGQILQRGSAAWQVLAPGTIGQYLASGGSAALNTWGTPAGTTYTAGTGLGLSGGAFSLSTPVSEANGGTGQTSLSAAIDNDFGSTEGQILQRGSSAWQALAHGAAGQLLQSGGASALNAWVGNGSTVFTITDASGAGLTFTVSSAVYTVVGKVGFVTVNMTFPTTASVAATLLNLVGPPAFTTFVIETTISTYTAVLLVAGYAGSSEISFNNPIGGAQVTNATLSGKTIIFNMTYPLY